MVVCNGRSFFVRCKTLPVVVLCCLFFYLATSKEGNEELDVH